MVEGASSVHVHLVVVPQVCNKEWDIPHNGAFRPSKWTVEWPKMALGFMLQLAVVCKDLRASKGEVLARELK